MNLLTQNSKLKSTSIITGKKTMDFALPAKKTCPYAGACLKYCYASKGTYVWPVVRSKHERNYQSTLRDSFVLDMFEEIVLSSCEAVRIHSSGDFYSGKYLIKWCQIAESLPHVTFYAYTKSVRLVKDWKVPSNFIIIYSFGGLEDRLINVERDRHAIVVPRGESVPMDYAIMADNDHVALASNHKIALPIH